MKIISKVLIDFFKSKIISQIVNIFALYKIFIIFEINF
jgi:hypothetical protein